MARIGKTNGYEISHVFERNDCDDSGDLVDSTQIPMSASFISDTI